MYVYTFLSIICTLPLALCYGNGKVTGSCGNMIPSHPASSQTSSAPYTVSVNQSSFQGGDTITVTLQGQSTAFRGFLLEAREVGGGQPVGTFSVTDSQAQLLACSGIINSAVSHTSPANKNSVKVLWKAPSSGVSKDIAFSATFVQDKVTFWVQVKSETVKFTGVPSTTTPSLPISFISSAECGNTKVCVSQPSNCNPASSSSCSFISVTAFSTNSTFHVEISGPASGYVATGFSNDQKMGNDDIYICVINGSGVQVQHAHSTGKVMPQILSQGQVSNVQSSVNNGVISCSFTSQNAITTQSRSAASNFTYYLLFASGPASGGSIKFHDNTFSSNQKVDLTNPQFLATSEPSSVKAHGALMLISWMTTGSLGMLIARYLKAATKQHRCCNKDFWFLVSFLFDNDIKILTLTFFFKLMNNISAFQGAHPVLGCIVMILALIQPIGAAFRCAPGNKWRFVFNWGHALNALVIKVLAVAAIFTGLGLIDNTDSRWLQKVMGGFVAWEVLCFLLYELNLRNCLKEKTERTSDSNTTEVVLLGIFFLGNIAFLVALLCGIGMS
ncbi:putative ferric-chelate reductase 1 isoform X1 [Arapaima gigas]